LIKPPIIKDMAMVILFLLAVILVPFFVLGIKESWNSPGMSEEEFNRLFRKNR